MVNEQKTLSIREASKLLGLCQVATRRAIERGELPAIRLGRRVLVLRGALDRLLQETGPAPAREGTSR